MRSVLQDLNKNPLKATLDAYKKVLSLSWVFEKWYEKLILAGCVLWSAYSLVRLLI